MSSPLLMRTLIAIAACCGLAAAQQETFLRVALRVTAGSPGTAIIDRGERDRLAAGDRVLLFPRGGGTWRGTVSRIDERSSVVQLDERDSVPEPGTRGEVLVPRARLRREDPAPADPAREAVPIDHPPWTPREDGWQEEMPLLAKVRPVRPEERAARFSGRTWAFGDLVRVPADRGRGRGDNSFARLGTDLRVENALSLGGRFRFDGELTWRSERDDDDSASTVGLVRTLSYEIGGTRFRPNRFELGRFLQAAMPEFGYLDGVEWSRRLDSGHRVGLSFGFLPNPYDELSTGDDLQVAASFRLVADELERLTFDLGLQKTWHDGDEDRDLLVLKGRWLADDGWDLAASAWIDRYTSGESPGAGSFELTQAWASVRRLLEDGRGFDLSYRRHAFPLVDRELFQPLTLAERAENASDRIALEGFSGPPGTDRVRGEIGGWADESSSGGHAEIGLGTTEAIVDDGELELTAFASAGRDTTMIGARVVLGRNTVGGRWDLLYEAANHHFQGRISGDDMLQQRLRASHSFFAGGGWTWSLHADGLLWDEELAWAAGFHVQKTF